MITLLGGEPMMYWDERIVPLARRIRYNFPRARINIFYNGHLLCKRADEVIDFINEISANVTITQHLMGDLDSKLGSKWQSNLNEFLSHPLIIKIHSEHYHIKNNIESNIHFTRSDNWFTWYKQDHQGLIKPYASNDPEKSMKYGCASGNYCASLFENKLYKCSSLAMLPGLLNTVGQNNDPDWKPYLDYPYVDVLDVDPEKLKFHVDSYGFPIAQCDMCNDQPANVVKWVDRKQESIIRGTV
jgi:hypothetical protein